jgi:hypothetical protein
MRDRALRRYSPRSNTARAVHKPRAFAANALDGGMTSASCLRSRRASWC